MSDIDRAYDAATLDASKAIPGWGTLGRATTTSASVVDVAALRKALAGATPGPWTVSSQYGNVDVFRHPYSPGDDMVAVEVFAPDAHLIALAVNALPALLDEVEAGRRMRAEVESLIAANERTPPGNGGSVDAGIDAADRAWRYDLRAILGSAS